MKHKYWSKNLSAYLDNEVTETKRREIECHLADCELCRSNLTAWKKIRDLRSEETALIPDRKSGKRYRVE